MESVRKGKNLQAYRRERTKLGTSIADGFFTNMKTRFTDERLPYETEQNKKRMRWLGASKSPMPSAVFYSA